MNESQPNKLRITRRGKIAVALAGLMLTGVAVKVGEVTHIEWPGGQEFTQEQLEGFDDASVTVPAGAGADEIVQKVEPSLSSDSQEFAEVSNYVRNQGTDVKDGHPALHQHQMVLVPLVPGIPHTVEK